MIVTSLFKLFQCFEETRTIEDYVRSGRLCLRNAHSHHVAAEMKGLASILEAGTSSAREAEK